MTKRESKVRAADQIVRLNPDIFGDVILRASDISLLIDTAGLILEVIYNTENKNLGDIEQWRTRNIRDFITKESGIKLEEILNLSSSENERIEKDIIQLNHIKNGGDDFPIQYSIHPTGVNNQILLFGRDLTQIAQAQQELMKTQLKFEREYDRYRSFDTKYRVILEQCGSAFIIVDEAGQLIDFNQKAVAILEKADLNQMMLKDLFYQGISIDILSELETLNKNTPSTALNLNVKETNKEVQLKGTFFRSNDGVHSLIRLSSSSSQRTSHSKEKIYLSDLYQKTSDAFVFINEAGKIVDTNESFLILTENPNIDEVVGKSFSDFLKNATTDLKILTDNSTMKILYISREEDPNQYDELLRETLSAALAADIAYAITSSNPTASNMFNLFQDKLKEARFVDSTEGQNLSPDKGMADVVGADTFINSRF